MTRYGPGRRRPCSGGRRPIQVLLVTLSTLVIIAVVVAAAVSIWQLKQPRDHTRTSPTTVIQHHSVEDMIERTGGHTDVICNNGVDPVIQAT